MKRGHFKYALCTLGALGAFARAQMYHNRLGKSFFGVVFLGVGGSCAIGRRIQLGGEGAI